MSRLAADLGLGSSPPISSLKHQQLHSPPDPGHCLEGPGVEEWLGPAVSQCFCLSSTLAGTWLSSTEHSIFLLPSLTPPTSLKLSVPLTYKVFLGASPLKRWSSSRVWCTHELCWLHCFLWICSTLENGDLSGSHKPHRRNGDFWGICKK